MKKLLFITVITCCLSTFTAFKAVKLTQPELEISVKDDYCEGWEEGYCEGWKDVKGKYAICPVAPICPIPEIGKDKYKDGYNRGFKAGYKKANKD